MTWINPEWRFSKYENIEALKAYLSGWLTCYISLPTELQELFLNKAVTERLMENVSPEKDEIALPYQLLAIRVKIHQ